MGKARTAPQRLHAQTQLRARLLLNGRTQHRARCPEEPRAVGSQTAGLEPCRSTLPWVLEALGSQ